MSRRGNLIHAARALAAKTVRPRTMRAWPVRGGTLGASGAPGTSGAPGMSSALDTFGTPGTSGTPSTFGTPGTLGTFGAPGTSGTLGTFGTPGTSGALDTFGTPGTLGVPGTSDTPGTFGAPGISGALDTFTSGAPGTFGAPGTPGTPGAFGVPGTFGTPGATSATGTLSMFGTLAIVGAAILFSAPGAALAANAANATSTASAATAAAQTAKEIVPGLTIVFPSPPVSDDDGGWVSTATLDGSPAAFLATRVSFDADDGKDIDQLLRMAPDVFAQMSGPMMESYLNRDDPTHRREVHTEEVRRGPATAGFPGLYFSERHIVPPAQDDEPKPDGAKKPAEHAFQAHGYVLFVNGTMVLLGITQRDDTKLDRKALERFVAASHFPPADNVGTLQDQLKAIGRDFTADANTRAGGSNSADSGNGSNAQTATPAQPDATDQANPPDNSTANGAATGDATTNDATTGNTAK